MRLYDIVDRYLAFQERRLERGEIKKRTYDDYAYSAETLKKDMGDVDLTKVTPMDWADLIHGLHRRWGHTRRSKFVVHVRSVMHWAYENELLEKPIRFGSGFTKVPQRIIRAERPVRLFSAREILGYLGRASVPMRAMVYLGINAGFGNNDCSTLPIDAIDWENRMLHWSRPKTGAPRTAPLWDETVRALRDAIRHRPEPICR